MPVHGGKILARALKQAGVECVFTLSGGHIMPLYDGCIDEGIRLIDVRHEQAAVHAADAWARCNPGRVGVAAITAGPGVTDGVTGVANAWRANSPILVIGGQGPFGNLRRGSLQEMDHVSVMRPITKFADAVYQTHRIGEYAELAIRHAVSGIPGPAFLEIPMDVFMGSVEWEQAPLPPIRTQPPRIAPDRADVRRALEILRAARRPMLMAGTSVKWSMASRELNAFLAATHVPAYTSGMGRGTIPPHGARVPEPLATQGHEADRLHRAGGDAARLPHGLRQHDPRRRKQQPQNWILTRRHLLAQRHEPQGGFPRDQLFTPDAAELCLRRRGRHAGARAYERRVRRHGSGGRGVLHHDQTVCL